jgi:phosphatidylglycerophosphate synthase
VSKVPAVLVCDAGTGNLKVAGLTVLDRMVVTAHRAGCGPITVVTDGRPRLTRADALGISVAFASPTSAGESVPGSSGALAAEVVTGDAVPGGLALTITGAVLLEARDLKRVIEGNGQLTAADRSLLPVRMTTAHPKPIAALGVAHAITDQASALEAERKFWKSLGSSADGLVDTFFNRPVGRVLSKVLVHTGISPNAVSVASILIGVASAPLFARGDFVLAALVLQLCAVVDCVDGDLARALFKQSQLGKWLDIGGDQVVHVAVFLGIGLGVARSYPHVPALALGISAAIGVLVSFPVIIRGLRQPPEQRGDILQKLMDSTANRDFTLLLLILALIGRMDLFLWMAGIGIHIFWIALLVLQNASMHRAAATR